MFHNIKLYIKRIYYRLRSNQTTEDLVKNGLEVGSNFLRMHDTIIDPSHCWLISIGDDVTLAPRVHILAHDASLCNFLGYARIGKVKIGNKVFIGADTVVLPNVKIGDNCIIGANSTVSRDIPANSVAVGSPAKIICSTEEFIKKNREMMKSRPCYGEDYTLRANIDNNKKEKMKEELESGFGYVV